MGIQIRAGVGLGVGIAGDGLGAWDWLPECAHVCPARSPNAVCGACNVQFETIMKLEGHHGEVWALTVSRLGDFVVSAGHDRSIRVWERTEEQVRVVAAVGDV